MAILYYKDYLKNIKNAISVILLKGNEIPQLYVFTHLSATEAKNVMAFEVSMSYFFWGPRLNKRFQTDITNGFMYGENSSSYLWAYKPKKKRKIVVNFEKKWYFASKIVLAIFSEKMALVIE